MALKTPEGVVRICCTGLLFSLPGSARKTHGIQNTPEGVFFTRQCRNTYDIQNTPVGGKKIVLHWSAVSLLDSAMNKHGIQNTPEGVVRLYYLGLLFLYQAVQGTHTAFKIHRRVIKNVLH
jgi:hypothetical protein